MMLPINGITAKDVAVMMSQLKVARIATGSSPDSFVDLAGYVACASEIATQQTDTKPVNNNENTCIMCSASIPLDDGLTCEINRLCTDGTRNACSMLYGACCRVAKEMGYVKIITYILESENGASLKASNFTCEGIAGGLKWTGSRDTGKEYPHEMKTRWSRRLI